jgi:hypothetical protein
LARILNHCQTPTYIGVLNHPDATAAATGVLNIYGLLSSTSSSCLFSTTVPGNFSSGLTATPNNLHNPLPNNSVTNDGKNAYNVQYGSVVKSIDKVSSAITANEATNNCAATASQMMEISSAMHVQMQ